MKLFIIVIVGIAYIYCKLWWSLVSGNHFILPSFSSCSELMWSKWCTYSKHQYNNTMYGVVLSEGIGCVILNEAANNI